MKIISSNYYQNLKHIFTAGCPMQLIGTDTFSVQLVKFVKIAKKYFFN